MTSRLRTLIVVVSLATLMAGAASAGARVERAGIAFDVPDNWTYVGSTGGAGLPDETPSGFPAGLWPRAPGTLMRWLDPQTGVTLVVWVSHELARVRARNQSTAAPMNVTAMLDDVVALKTTQRSRERDYDRWRVRPDSVRRTPIGGHQAVVAIADFDSRESRSPKVEYLTWIYTPATRVLFFATMSPGQFAAFQPAFDRIVQSVTLP